MYFAVASRVWRRVMMSAPQHADALPVRIDLSPIDFAEVGKSRLPAHLVRIPVDEGLPGRAERPEGHSVAEDVLGPGFGRFQVAIPDVLPLGDVVRYGRPVIYGPLLVLGLEFVVGVDLLDLP